jgi:iron complex outermembrane recepter protein
MQVCCAWGRFKFDRYLWNSSFGTKLGLAVAAVLIALPLPAPAKSLDRLATAVEHPASKSKATGSIILRNSRQLLAQANRAPSNITGIKLNPKNGGIEVILETAGTISAPAPQIVGKLLYFDLPNATITQPFRATNPAQGIESVSVTQIDSGYVRVTVIGTNSAPQATVIAGAAGKSPVAQPPPEEELEINVIGGRALAYRANNTSSATKTDTPLRDIPQSVQVIPQKVLKDQQVTKLEEGLRNVSGITFGGAGEGAGVDLGLRGFGGAPILLNGTRQFGAVGLQDTLETANLESIDVLKGPASILFGDIQPGGAVNLISKKPLANPAYTAEVQFGSRGLIRPSIDVTGPLTADKNVRYRLNALTSSEQPFRDFNSNFQRTFLAPSIGIKIGDRTDLDLKLEYLNSRQPFDTGRVAFGNRVIDTPRNRIFNQPDDFVQNKVVNVGYNIEHRFNDNLKLQNSFRYLDRNILQEFAFPSAFDPATGIITQNFGGFDIDVKSYSLQTNLVSKFTTGSIQHQLVSGIDVNRATDNTIAGLDFANPSPLDVFNPVYGNIARTNFRNGDLLFVNRQVDENRLAVYVQDQISVLDNLKVVLGLRYDTLDQKTTGRPTASDPVGVNTAQFDSAVTPRVGIVYQPSKAISLYTSYSQSFSPSTSLSVSGTPLKPERGQGYEVGVKAELAGDKLFATLAYFDITKQGVATTDPSNPLFSIATGEQKSKGVELDVTGQILPGWNVIASYAYIDARVSQDNTFAIGNQLAGVPSNSISLWTNYEIPQGNLQGLGAGFGFNYIGNRQGNLANTFELGSYFLTNAAISYRRDNWKAALNFKNIFNVDYSNTPFGDNRIDVGQPFTVVGSLSVEF